MPYIEPETVLKAKQIDLLSYLQRCEPGNLVRVSGDTYCTKEHDSLKISHGKWCWWSRGIGGKTALDYLIKVKNLNFIEAVETLIGQSAIQPAAFSYAQKDDPAGEKRLLLPELSAYPARAKAYLMERGIDEEILAYCIANGSIREDARHHMDADCDDCPEHCEACGTCSKEGNYVPNRGKCASCSYRCSVCYACTCDDSKEARKERTR